MLRPATLLFVLTLVLASPSGPALAGGWTMFDRGCETTSIDACDGCCHGCCRPSRWRHVRTWIGAGCFCTTGMMSPHYPYAPECHGHYDFSPYTALRLEEQRILGTTLGEPPENPYARSPFGDVYPTLPNTEYTGDLRYSSVPQLPRVEPALPDVESILADLDRDPPTPEFPVLPE